uniref:Protein SSUH2 homolog n=1 Tax=Pundamilia nyererei TaxID=303518 RepID=A0A3B4GWJ8_9CICH
MISTQTVTLPQKQSFLPIFSGTFDPNIPEEGPSAPPPGWLDDIHGYQGLKGGGEPSIFFSRVPSVSEDVARDALLKFVESKWNYSSKPARNLTFKDLQPITVYRYRLETYTETRASAWQFEPYNGQTVDGPQYGMSPAPWDIPVSLPQRYTDKVEKIRVPHSSFVKVCHKCKGCGRTRCTACFGRGQKRCTFCHGRGRIRNKHCTSCHGRGRKRCLSCHSHGYKTCSVCLGSQNLLHFIQLTVTWYQNHSKCSHGPPYDITASAVCVYFLNVYPIQGFPDQEICEVSTKLINEHLERFTATSRILQQVRGPLGRSQTPSLRFVALCHSERPISLLSVRASSWCPSLMPITPTAGRTTASSSTGWRTKCLPPNIPLHVPSCRQHGIDI